MASKVKTIVLLRIPHFREEQRRAIEEWLNKAMTYDRYKVELVEFLSTEPSIIMSHDVGEKDI